MENQEQSLFEKLNILGKDDIQTNVNLNLSTEIYFYLGLTIVLSVLVASILSGISKEVIGK